MMLALRPYQEIPSRHVQYAAMQLYMLTWHGASIHRFVFFVCIRTYVHTSAVYLSTRSKWRGGDGVR